jgi:hypothetical protein
MFPRIFTIGLLGLAPLLGSGCSGQSGTPPASSGGGGPTADRKSDAPAKTASAEKDAKTKQIALAVTGMT